MYQLIHFQLLDIVHPAAKTLVDIAKSQDAEVGDGTTSVVMLAGNWQSYGFFPTMILFRLLLRKNLYSFDMCIFFILIQGSS